MSSRLAAAAALALTALVVVSGCRPKTESAPPPETADAAPAATTAAQPTPEPTSAAVAPAARPAVAGAPAYAAIYPGGELDGAPTAASGAAGDGGLVTYVTEARPDDVIAFYKERAEAAGLASTAGMNQGEARAYGASEPGDAGASLQVVASPTTEGETSVQLSWSEGG
jgi:hypothetical protein